MTTYNYGKSTTKMTAAEAVSTVLKWSVFFMLGAIAGVLLFVRVTGHVPEEASEPAVTQPAAVAAQ